MEEMESVERRKRKRKRNYTLPIIAVIIIALIFCFIKFFIFAPGVSYRTNIMEIEPGIYGYQQESISNIPAQNYTMLTYCDSQGDICTFKGTVKSVIDNTGDPHIFYERSNRYGARITIYAPAGTIKYLGAIEGGR